MSVRQRATVLIDSETPPAWRESKPEARGQRGATSASPVYGVRTETTQIWASHSSDGPDWLCQECHPAMTAPDR